LAWVIDVRVGIARVVRVGVVRVGVVRVGIVRVGIVRAGFAPATLVGVGIVRVGLARVALAANLARRLRRLRHVPAGEASGGADVTPGVKMIASTERWSCVAHDVFISDRVAAAAEPRDQKEWMWAWQSSDFLTGRGSA
jgi:hypothetical protein